MKIITILILFLAITLFPQPVAEETTEQKDLRMQWWRDARFGMFIHWGLYAIPAGEWNGEYTPSTGEWIMEFLKIPVSEYEKLATEFNPVEFDAGEWVKAAKDAGMKYIVITAKHHDGFCLFPSGNADWDISSTPFKRDPLKELADECSKQGIKLCFYYSIMDWHHPYYPQRRPWNDKAAAEPDMSKYIEYMKGHIKELLTKYGPVGILWFDGEWEESWTNERAEELIQFIKNLQPDIIINNRVGKARSGMQGFALPGQKALGDYGTPEQEIPPTGLPGVDWETCMTMNDTWGYRKDDNNWKSSETLIYNLIDIASKGGNFLLNVGPTAEGKIPEASMVRLADIGKWMQINGESIYGTNASPFSESPWGKCTQKAVGSNTRLYLHVLNYPGDSKLKLWGLMNKPLNAFLLSDKNKNNLDVNNKDGAITILLPPEPADNYNNIVVLDIEGKPEIINAPAINYPSKIFIDSLIIDLPFQYDDTEIRYSLDGSTPGPDSDLLHGSIIINNSSVVTARYFRDGLPVSDITKAEFKKVFPLPGITIDNLTNGVKFKYYEGKWAHLPDFASIDIVKEGVLPGIELGQNNIKENYAFEFSGYIKIPVDGVYTFYLGSDDGSCLFIDDSLVVNNDGLHGMTELSNEIALQKGFHKIRVTYFQAGGGDGLNVSYKEPGKEKMKIPESELFYLK